uniref:Putative Aminotransferase-like, plant mobile domain-containing protein n=1 Tax=Davidia involucrata TaxID=16924 RepID=A0A5B7BTJ7_DAVIN
MGNNEVQWHGWSRKWNTRMKRKQSAKKEKSPILKKIKNDTDRASVSKKDGPKAKKSEIIKKPPSYFRFMAEYIMKEKEKNPSNVFPIKKVNEVASKTWNTMAKSERAKYIAQTQNEMIIYKSKCPPKPPKKNDVAILQTRSQLHEFVDIVKGFDQSKKKAVQEIDFGGLLLLKCSIVR